MKRIPYKDLQGLIANLEAIHANTGSAQEFSATETPEAYEFRNIGPFKKVELLRRLLLPTRQPGQFCHPYDVWMQFARTARETGEYNILSAPEYASIIFGLYDHREHPVVANMVKHIAMNNDIDPFTTLSLTCASLTELHRDRSIGVTQAISVLHSGRTSIRTLRLHEKVTSEDNFRHLFGPLGVEIALKLNHAFGWFADCSPDKIQLLLPPERDVYGYYPVTVRKFEDALIIDVTDVNKEMPCIGIGARIEYYDGKP